jgi:glycerophosphoryl diester phosphodiesterase
MEKVSKPVRVAHRGAAMSAPQNSPAAFRQALETGADMIETDLRLSADGEIVLAHDDEIRHPDGTPVVVADHTLEELRRVDLGGGEKIPTLADLLEITRNRCAVMADLKGEGFEEKLVGLLHQYEFTDVIIPGGSPLSRQRIRKLDPNLPLSLSLDEEWKPRLDDDFIASIETDAVTWHYALLDEPMIARLHERGLKVFAWTVDSADEMSRLLACGADGIISNRVDLLMRL